MLSNEEKYDYILKVIAFDIYEKHTPVKDLSMRDVPPFSLLPKRLYKYRHFGEHGYPEDYLRDNQVFVSSVYKQNDRFEGISDATVERIRQSKLDELWTGYKSDIVEAIITSFPDVKKEDAAEVVACFRGEGFDDGLAFERMKCLLPGVPDHRILSVVNNIQRTLNRFDKDSANAKRTEKVISDIAQANHNMGIYALSETPTNDTMWAHYADNFQGYVIEYDFSQPFRSSGSKKFVGSLFPVLYDNEKDDDWLKAAYLTLFQSYSIKGVNSEVGGIDFTARLMRMLCTKMEDWSSEKEWRYIGAAGKKIHGPLISSIIAGDKIKAEDLELLLKYVDGKYPLSIVYPNRSSKKLEIKPLKEEDIRRLLSRR